MLMVRLRIGFSATGSSGWQHVHVPIVCPPVSEHALCLERLHLAADMPDSSVVFAGYSHGRGGQPQRDQPYSRGPGPGDPYTREPHSRPHCHIGWLPTSADCFRTPPCGSPTTNAYGAPSRDPCSRDLYALSRDSCASSARGAYQPPDCQPPHGTQPSHASPPWQAQQPAPASSRRPEQSNNPYAALLRDQRQR